MVLLKQLIEKKKKRVSRFESMGKKDESKKSVVTTTQPTTSSPDDTPKWNPFLDLSNNAIAIRFKELDQCCCADVPCISIVKEYCESSSLHGLRYITEDGRHWTERALWVVLSLLGFILTAYFIWPIWVKWHLKPTLTTLDSTDHPIWKIDFPGVTVCPANKAIRMKLNGIKDREPWKTEVDTYNTTTEDLKRLVELMVHFKSYKTVREQFSDLEEIFDRIGQGNLTNLMVNVMPNCEDYILKCWWKGELQNCKDLFQIRKTDDGFCCSFNTVRPTETLDMSMLNYGDSFEEDDWMNLYYDTAETFEYPGNYDEVTIPEDPQIVKESRTKQRTILKRQTSASPRLGLTVLLDAKSEDYFITSDTFVGFKILVHDPRAYPEVDGRALLVGPEREFFMTVTASHTQGSEAIRDLTVQRRNCLFSDERKIDSEVSAFKVYSRENCFLECRAKLLLEKCGCLPYYYPPLDVIFQNRKEFKRFNLTCDWDGWNCLVNSTDLLEAIDPIADSGIEGAVCDCPPACTRTDYLAAQSFADFPNKASTLYQIIQNGEERNHLSDLALVHIFFRELKMFKYTTDELFSWNDILASFGGLVGLCTGFSFLSLAELLYFFSLRCMLPLCRQRRKDKVATLSNADLVVVKVESEDTGHA